MLMLKRSMDENNHNSQDRKQRHHTTDREGWTNKTSGAAENAKLVERQTKSTDKPASVDTPMRKDASAGVLSNFSCIWIVRDRIAQD